MAKLGTTELIKRQEYKGYLIETYLTCDSTGHCFYTSYLEGIKCGPERFNCDETHNKVCDLIWNNPGKFPWNINKPDTRPS